MKAKDKSSGMYNLRDNGFGYIQIRKNDKTTIDIVAVMVFEGCGQFTTSQSRKESKKLATRIVRLLNQ